MLEFLTSSRTHELESIVHAIGKSQAMIEFALDGTIISANANFLAAVGYSLSQIEGKHHSLFVSPAERESVEYRQFWASLARGEFQAGEFKRVGNGDKEIWLRATYNPILDRSGKPIKVIKFAADVTAEKLISASYQGQIKAIGSSQAVIEFNLDGTIVMANENFLNTVGYSLAEIQGKHHSMFVQHDERDSAAYKQFWASLNRGEFQSGEFKRVGKGAKDIWLQATYNPIRDTSGKPVKVVKFATDVTHTKLQNANYLGQIDAIGKSQAVIEFELDGTIVTANENFLEAVGYSLAEIQGKHHSMFVEPAMRDSIEYREFWASLARGEYQSAEYKRIRKGGADLWLQATYNPILDLNGQPFKVVKFAADVTRQVIARKKSEHVRGMMESVAAGAEELNASVREIAEKMVMSKDTASSAVGRVEVADQFTHRLSEAAQAMGGIVHLINNITSQINLLALNATIESARAGDAGKGFAVVANEVKNLAAQARSATEQISKEIDGMRTISQDVVGALVDIRKSIESVSEYVTSTAAAVEQQSMVAGEMSSNMQRAAAEANSLGAA